MLLTEKQKRSLEKEWNILKIFDRKRIVKIATTLKLRPRKIYKWVWDRKAGYLAGSESPVTSKATTKRELNRK